MATPVVYRGGVVHVYTVIYSTTFGSGGGGDFYAIYKYSLLFFAFSFFNDIHTYPDVRALVISYQVLHGAVDRKRYI